jgi:hypothetical protein
MLMCLLITKRFASPINFDGFTIGLSDPQLAYFAQNIPDWDHHTIVGCSQKLEKPYLRLTSVGAFSQSSFKRWV